MKNVAPAINKTQLITELTKYNIHQYDEGKCLYKYVDINTAKLILENHTMKFSTSYELKDYDLESCLLNHNYSNSFMRQKLDEVIYASLREDLHLVNRSQIRGFLKTPKGKEMLKTFDIEVFRKELLNSFEDQKNTIGMFCATTSPNKAEMWNTKYADYGKGVCMEYKFKSLYNSLFIGFKVHYDSEMKSLDYLDGNSKPNIVAMHRWLFTKALRYSLEDEVRLIAKLGNVGIFPAPKDIFTGIYYGKETSLSDISDLELLVKNGDYSFKKGIKADY